MGGEGERFGERCRDVSVLTTLNLFQLTNSFIIYSNRNEFANFILESLRQKIGSGALGSCVLSVSYAFRDDNNKISGGRQV